MMKLRTRKISSRNVYIRKSRIFVHPRSNTTFLSPSRSILSRKNNNSNNSFLQPQYLHKAVCGVAPAQLILFLSTHFCNYLRNKHNNKNARVSLYYFPCRYKQAFTALKSPIKYLSRIVPLAESRVEKKNEREREKKIPPQCAQVRMLLKLMSYGFSLPRAFFDLSASYIYMNDVIFPLGFQLDIYTCMCVCVCAVTIQACDPRFGGVMSRVTISKESSLVIFFFTLWV